MDKVESVQINQSILGRMLDYGDVTILGTGEGFETLRTIARPIELRNSITGTTHKPRIAWPSYGQLPGHPPTRCRCRPCRGYSRSRQG